MIENEQTIIIGFIGEQEVGKSAIIKKYFRNTELTQYNPTIAVEVSYSSYECDEGSMLRIKCWDTSGENKYKNMVCYHLKEADIIVIVFDLTSQTSFAKVDEWVNRMKNQKVTPKVLCLIGNKLDLAKMPTLRKISRKQGQQKAKEINAIYSQISAKVDMKFEILNDAFEQILNERAAKIIQINKMKTTINNQAMSRIDKNGVKVPCQCCIY